MKPELTIEETPSRPIADWMREWGASVAIPDDYEPETIEDKELLNLPPARNYEERQAARIENMYKGRHFHHMTTHGMSSMPRHVRLRAVRGGCFVDVYYTYAFIQMPFNSIRLARKYVKYMGLPLQSGE